ncbi:MAG: putative DNA-binding domain-containing protein [Proteobacteria bacterium]|nr:putative DNA-binding domain-containing protein [Pseudomonadota bacterium]
MAEVMADPGLDELQAWLLAQVSGGTWGAGEAAAEVVVSSNVLSAEERLGIYARSYVARLAECLKAEFPVLLALVGESVFNLFAGAYLSAHKPWSYSLYDLGAGFPAYLDASRPKPDTGPGTLDALPASLARLERAMAEAHRAEGPETSGGLDAAHLLIDPTIPLRAPETLRLLRLDFDLLPTLAQGHADRRPDPPTPGKHLVAVARNHWRVRVHPLEPWAFDWLARLQQTGEAEAGDPRLMTWLPRAAEAGLVVRA